MTMNPSALTDTADFYRIDASSKLNAQTRSALGQFMTPPPIARYMTSLFSDLSGDLSMLDPGAGVGSLTAAFAERICMGCGTHSVMFSAYEIEPILMEYLDRTIAEAESQCRLAGIETDCQVSGEDFILSHPCSVGQPNPCGADRTRHGFTHVIMNPPYRKIHSGSPWRLALRQAGIEASNLYAAFMYLAAESLMEGGEMVAIVPRSFCNGPYFKAFRDRFFSMMTLQHIHIFEKRNCAFRNDEVLQENLIVHAIKGKRHDTVEITSSTGGNFEACEDQKSHIGENMTQNTVKYEAVIDPRDTEKFVHIAVSDLDQRIANRMKLFGARLDDLDLQVSTGPVVDFRMKDDLCIERQRDTAPLLYSRHFRDGMLAWPDGSGRPNYIRISERSRKWLWKNTGTFVIARRFSPKELKRRIDASLYNSCLPGDLVGFENRLNVFHNNQRGLPVQLATGLNIFLNSSLVDRYFRQFNGHTQVNATDLRSLKYPDRETMERIGRTAGDATLSQQEIDAIIENEITAMTDEENPIKAQQKIDEALEILIGLDMPKAQQNERSALTLLALSSIKPDQGWHELDRPLIGITPIMQYAKDTYGRQYAPNTRETFRRQTMHQFVEAGIAVYNPDKPDRPVNSPKACYQLSEAALDAIRRYGTEDWSNAAQEFLKSRGSLVVALAMPREMHKIPVQVANDYTINLTPGAHSELIGRIIVDFAPRFAPGAEVVYVGDTGSKNVYFQQDRFTDLGMTVDQHGKMPDVILYFGGKHWLLLVEAVTSHGPVDALRLRSLQKMFADASPGLVYITAFPDRGVMARYLKDISWETEVWCADTPSHLIHFNGERFLGPYLDSKS